MEANYVLHVSDGVASEQVLLESAVEDEDWYAPSEATPDELDGGLDADADELVASEAAEALRSLGHVWPVCPQHRREMGMCEGWWCCEGEPYHDVAQVGSLTAG